MKKTTQKLLSIVLVLAVVVSTVCGALIGAYAATADNAYNIVSQGDIAAGTKTITYTVTLTDSQGMTSGVFDLMLSGDVIDDANFGTKLNDKDEIVPDYSNYLEQPNSYTLEDLVGEKTETREETTEVTNDFEWRVDTTTEKQWSATDPDGAELGWQSTGNTRTKDKWVKVEGSTRYATSDPDGSALAWQSTGNTKTQDNWTETTVQLKLSQVPADTATVKYVQGAKVQDNWSNTTETKRANYDSTGIIDNNGTTRWVINTNDWVRGAATGETKTTYSTQSSTDEYEWVKGSWTVSGYKWTQYYKSYLYTKQTNDPTYTYTKRENKPVTTYEYQEYKNDIITETEYQKYNKIYFKTTVTYGKSKLDLDGNNIIANVNTYEIQKVEVPVYDADGNVTYEEKEQEVLVNEHKEPTGNKGTLLPNAFDNANKLWDTKIEITGGTKLDGTEFNIGDFTNDNYSSMADADDTSTQKIEGSKDGVKYVYNMTDDYKEACTKYPSSYTNPVNDKNLLHGYYREYTTVDVATENLGYSISTVSEDCTTWAPQYTQYAQGFKDITFNTESAYTSITFTVTLDFTGLCDRISANGAVRSDEYIGTNDDGTTYRITDGHSAGENYVHYGKKYQLNLINAEGDVAALAATDTNALTSFSHVHDGHISEAIGKADPNNIEAIKAAGLEKADNKTYFNIFDAKCSICGRVTPMLASTNMPYREYTYDDDGDISGTQAAKTGMYSFNQYRNLTAINLTYQPDGTVSLNIHYPSAIEGEKFIITDQNGKVLSYSDTVTDEPKYIESVDDEGNNTGNKQASFYASTRADGTSYYEGLLLSSSKMVTIDNLSAQDVDKVLYIAKYTPKSSTETQLMGITHTISLSDYCNKVINEESVYYNKLDGSFSETKVEQDKLVAAAFMNYANASKTSIANKTVDYVAPVVKEKIDLLEFGQYLIDAGSTNSYYDTNVADNGETGDSWENAIIIDSAEELVYLCKGSGNETKGKYYKVADDILAFDLSNGNLDFNGTLEDNLAKVQASGKNHAGGDSNAFQGYFDGNGVTVYGAWTNHNQVSANAGLFTQTKGGVIIKNVHVKFASFTANSAAGGIIGYSKADEMCTITIENCSVTDSHIEVKNSAWGNGAGAIVGRGGSAPSYKETESTGDVNGNGTIGDTIYVNVIYNIKNCYVNLDEDYFITKDEGTSVAGNQVCHGGVVGVCDSNALNVQDSVVIGIKPYATSISNNNNAVQHSGLETHFKNVYTTDDVAITGVYLGGTLTNRNFTNKVFPLSQDKMTGEAAKTNMSKLDWDKTWYVADDGSIGIYAPCDVPVFTDRTIYWDGSTTKTAPSTGNGTKENPYIISSVNELLYIFGQTAANYAITDGKYYKIDDSISNIVLQPEAYGAEIMALSSAADTKAYFEKNASKMKTWNYYGWEGSTFCGNIDFNGATVYGIYQVSSNNAGFISNVDAGAVVSNLTIKNSYLKSNSEKANYQAAVLAAVTNGNTYGKATDGFVWFNNVEISNNYVYNNSTSGDRSGVMIGASSDIVYMDNCLVYGNDATYGDGVKMPIWSTANNSVTTSSNPKAPEGLVTVTDNATDPMYYNMVRNSILLGVAPYDITQKAGARFNDEECFENVYTDMLANNVACAENTVLKTTLAQIKQIDVSKISGINAKSVMPNLDWYDAATNPDGVWHYSYVSTMPSLEKKTVSIIEEIAELGGQYETFASSYNNIKFETPDTIGEDTQYHENGTMTFGVYQTALSLKANPYLSFAFAFYGEYQSNRDKIQIRFSYYDKNGDVVTTEPISPPAATYTDGDAKGKPDNIVNVNGWTNKKANGRYHTYAAKDLPIEAMVNGITVEMNYNNEGWKNYGTFDIEGIGYQFEQANATTPCEYYQSRIDAAKSLVFYINALSLRYGI